MWAAVFLLMRRVLRDGRQVVLSGRLWALLGLLALSPLLSELTFSLWNIRAYTAAGVDELIDAAFYTLLPFVFVSSIALLFAVVLLARHQALEQEHQMADMREIYYQGIRREQEQVRRMRHDMRNHLTALSGLPRSRGRAAARPDYVHRLQQASGPAGSGHFTDNETVNIVLAAKARDMAQAGLEADISVSLPEKLPVADPDLCALFGNALDNAAEAAQDAPDKRVTVRARADKGLLMLRVRNAYTGERQADAGRPVCHLQGGTGAPTGSACAVCARSPRAMAVRLRPTAQDGVFELIACLPLQT